MTNVEENKMTMYKSTGDKLKENITIWQTNTPMVNAANEMTSLRDQILAKAKSQSSQDKGLAVTSNGLKLIMTDNAVDIADIIRAYAYDTQDMTLAERVNYKKSAILKSRDILAVKDCDAIYDIANNLVTTKPAIAAYQINAAKVSALRTSIDNYTASIATPRDATVSRATSTGELKALFRKFDNLLKNRIDNLMKMYRVSHPTFYSDYIRARMIIDLGIRHEPKTPV